MWNDPRAFYLEDGQTEPRITDWQTRLSESRTAVLSVLSSATEQASFETLSRTWDGLRAELGERIRGIARAADASSSRIPTPNGFFAGKDERASAHREVCRLLCDLEERVQELHLLSARSLRLRLQAAERLSERFQTELRFYEITEAAKRSGDAEAERQSAALRKTWEARVKQGEGLLETLERTADALTEFSLRTFPDFYERMHELADMENGGAACDPVGMSSLCGELRAATEGFLLILEG